MCGAVDNDTTASVCVHLAHRINTLGCAGEWILDGVVAVQNAARWEVGRVDVFAEIVDGEFWVGDEGDSGVGDFAKVMRRDVRCHTDGDSGGAVHQQVW